MPKKTNTIKKITTKKEDNLFVIGIGASAGGLASLQNLLSTMPLIEDVALVVIQHLSPNFKSYMVDILSKNSKIPISEIVHNSEVKGGNLYVLPPNKHVEIKSNKFVLSDRVEGEIINNAVDVFFTSLAIDKGARALGVILSGTGSDGTLGCIEIKKLGGKVAVEDPLFAQYDGMPSHVIENGASDWVVAAWDIPFAIKNFIEAFENRPKKDDVESQKINQYERIVRLISKRTNIDFKSYKMQTLGRVIEKRLLLSDLKSLDEFYNFLENSEEEQNILKFEFLIGVTQFFRDTEAFELFAEKAIPEICKKKKEGDTIRIWCVGVFTGQEAYTVSILFDQYLRKKKLDLKVKIFATDLLTEALKIASTGHFPKNIAKHVPKEILKSHFIEDPHGYRVIRTIRDSIIFSEHNLLLNPPFNKLDLVVCRNVFIYLKEIGQKRALTIFEYSLNAGGLLMLGNSEYIDPSIHQFEAINKKWNLYKLKEKVNKPEGIPLGVTFSKLQYKQNKSISEKLKKNG